MEITPFDIDRIEFLVCHFDSAFIFRRVQLRFDLQSGLGLCAGDQLYDQIMADERTTPPVLRDMTKQSMFDLVPLAGAWWKVADVQRQAGFIG